MQIPCVLQDCNFITTINRFILFLNPVVVLVFLGIFLYGGFVYMTAGDVEERII